MYYTFQIVVQIYKCFQTQLNVVLLNVFFHDTQSCGNSNEAGILSEKILDGQSTGKHRNISAHGNINICVYQTRPSTTDVLNCVLLLPAA